MAVVEYLWLVGLTLWTFFCVWSGHYLTMLSVRDARQEWYARERKRLSEEARRVVESAIGEERAERLWNW